MVDQIFDSLNKIFEQYRKYEDFFLIFNFLLKDLGHFLCKLEIMLQKCKNLFETWSSL